MPLLPAANRVFGDGGMAAGEMEERTSGGVQPVYWEHLDVEVAAASDDSLFSLDAGWVRHYLPDGTLDTSFGTEGRLNAQDPEGMPFVATDLAVDDSGRVLVFGTSDGPQKLVGPYPSGLVGPRYATVLRYLADGRPDPGLGGDGSVLFDFAREGMAAPGEAIFATSGAVDPLDRIVLVAARQEVEAGEGHSYFAVNDRWIARLDEAGRPDPGFSDDGLAPLGRAGTAVIGLAFGGEGGVTISGQAGVERLRSDGARDIGFRVNRALIPPAPLPAGDGKGRTILAGSDDFRRNRRFSHISVTRLLRDGKRDLGFGRRGEAELQLKGRYEFAELLAAGGRILLVGRTFGRRAKLTPRIAIVRLEGSGGIDRGFGRKGIVTTRFRSPPAAVTPTDALVDPRGRLVIGAATVWPEIWPSGAPALLRYRLR